VMTLGQAIWRLPVGEVCALIDVNSWIVGQFLVSGRNLYQKAAARKRKRAQKSLTA